MPLEVNEIGIVMRVRDDFGHTGEAGVDQQQSEERREELIEECVRRVLQALEMERER